MSTQSRIDAESLRKLGFDEDLIHEALQRQKRSVYDIAPPADLVQRTMERCAHLLNAEPADRSSNDEWGPFFKRPEFALASTSDPVQFFADVATAICTEYTRAVGHAFVAHERPLVILENHNLVKPSWWYQDPVFRSMRAAAGTVNRTVVAGGLAPSAVVVVLRPRLMDYGNDELEMLATQIRDATSDVWWMRYDPASSYAKQDVVVIGQDSIIRLDVKTESPMEAIEAFKTATNRELVQRVRADLLGYCVHHSTSVKVGGQLEGPFAGVELNPDTVRKALEAVIAGAAV